MAGKPKRGLGRGLSALIADIGADVPDAAPPPDRLLPIEALRPNPDQPRRAFPEDALDELAASIRARGVIQPLVVRPDPSAPGAYQIVAGERRWRAAQRAGLSEVPAVVRDYDDAAVMEIAIIENVQRADLNAIDEGAAYRALIDRFGHTQEQVAGALGKSRSHVANQMRLLALPPEVQAMVADGRLAAGHARPLVGHPRALDLARRIAARGLSARDAERLARAPARQPRPGKDPNTRVIEENTSAMLGLPVSIDHRGAAGGRVTIDYKTVHQLDDLLRRLLRREGRPGDPLGPRTPATGE